MTTQFFADDDTGQEWGTFEDFCYDVEATLGSVEDADDYVIPDWTDDEDGLEENS